MSSAPTSPTASDRPAPFKGLEELKAEHGDLLRRRRFYENGSDAPREFLDDVERFLLRGRATGVVLEGEDRYTAQGLLSYWSNYLYRSNQDAPDCALADFDITQAPALEEGLCPYGELGVMESGDTTRSAGWKRLIEESVKRLKENRLAALVGAEGSGKSSLVRGGLLPALMGGVLPGSASWRYLPTVRPGADPLAGLARALCPPGADPAGWAAAQVPLLRQDRSHLTRLLASAGEPPALLVVDDFQQLFTRADRADAQAFLASLLAFVRDPAGGGYAVLGLSPDCLGYVAAVDDFSPVFQAGLVPVAFSTRELRQTIEVPARSVGLQFDEGIVDRLLLEIQGDPGAVTLLQFTLLRLWEQRQGNRITREVYNQLGGGRLALERAAEEVAADLSPGERDTLRAVLLTLVRPGVGQEVNCQEVDPDALYRLGRPRAEVDRVLERLRAARLVVGPPGAAAGAGPVRLVHTALASVWPPLVEWLAEARETQRRRARLTAAAEQWSRGRSDGVLWTSPDLVREALDHAAAPLSPLEREFLEASDRRIHRVERERDEARQRELRQALQVAEAETRRADAESRAKRVFRWMTAALTVASISAVVGWAVAKRNEAEARTNADVATMNAGLADDARRETEHALTKEVAERRQKQQALGLVNLAQGQGVLESGDAAGALLWFFQAREEASKVGEAAGPAPSLHEARVGAQFRQLPGLVFFDTRPGEGGGSARNMVAARFSPRGDCLAWATRRAVRVAGFGAGRQAIPVELKASIPDSLGVNDVQFSPDGGRLLAVHGRDSGVPCGVLAWEPRADGQWTPAAWASSDQGAVASDGRVLSFAAFSPPTAAGNPAGWLLTAREHLPPDFDPDKVDGKPVVEVCGSGGADGRRVRLPMDRVGKFRLGVLSADGERAVTAIRLPRPSPDAGVRDVVQVWASNLGSDGLPGPVGVLGLALLGAVPGPGASPVLHACRQVLATLVGRETTSSGNPLCQMPLPESNLPLARAVFSADRRLLVTVHKAEGEDIGEVIVWDLRDPARPRYLVHRTGATDGQLSPDGKYLVIATDPQAQAVLYRIDLDPGLREGSSAVYLGVLRHKSSVFMGSFSPDGRLAATGSRDRALGVWDATSAQAVLPPVYLDGTVGEVAFSPDGRCVLGRSNTTVAVWDLGTLNPPPARLGGNGGVRRAALSGDGTLVAGVVANGQGNDEVRIWDAEGRETKLGPGAISGTITLLALDTHGHRLAAVVSAESQGGAAVTSEVLYWDLRGGSRARPVSLPHQGPVSFTAFAPGGTMLATIEATHEGGASRGRANFWALESAPAPSGGRGSCRSINLWYQNGRPAAGRQDLHSEPVLGAALGRDRQGQLRLATASSDDSVRLWDVETGEFIRALGERAGAAGPRKSADAHTANVNCVAFSEDGEWLVTGSADRTARLWRVQDGGLRGVAENDGIVSGVAVTGDGRCFATAGKEGGARVWAMDGGEAPEAPRVRLLAVLPHSGPVTQVAFAGYDRLVTVGMRVPFPNYRPPREASEAARREQPTLVHHWSLAGPSKGEEAVCRKYAELVAARHYDGAQGRLAGLSAEELKTRFDDCRDKLPQTGQGGGRR